MNSRAAPSPADNSSLEALAIRPLTHFDHCRDDPHPRSRLRTVQAAAEKLREEMLGKGRPVTYYRNIDLVRVPYPTRYGLYNAARVPSPFMHILNRMFVLQFETHLGPKTLLFSPSDIDANRETPFFKRLGSRFGALSPLMNRFMAPILNRVEDALELTGIRPEEVDFISYDHLHTQDLRKWLGTGPRDGFFPNARLLVMSQEWHSAQALLPPQQDWYCPGGLEGIHPDRVVLLDGSVMLGESVALVRTPGHTEGNHSLVAHTTDGLLVTSENGVSADSFSPRHSRIPGVRRYALQTGMEVILNGNTQEGGLDQYMSMVLEKTLAGPALRNPDFYNVVPSSELTAYWGFPGLAPTFSFGQLCYGRPHGGRHPIAADVTSAAGA